MTSITQTIPSFVQGISQQPDELKLPGQVNDMLNCIPDITEGLTKRPGSKLVASLSGATSDGAWFSYFRDEQEGAYIGQVDNSGNVRMWTTDGTSCSVTNSASSYLASSNASQKLKFLTVNDYTFVTNTSKTVNMSGSVTSSKATLNGSGEYTAFCELRTLAPARQYSLDVSTPGGGVQDLDSGKGMATRIGFYGSPSYTSIPGGAGAYTRVDPNLPNVGTQVYTVNTGSGKNLAFRLTVTGQVAVDKQAQGNVEADDYAGVYDRRVELIYGGNGWSGGETVTVSLNGVNHTIEIKEISVIKCRCNIGSFRPKPTSFENGQELSAESILSQYANTSELGSNRAFTMSDSGVSVAAVPVGNGLFLWSSSPFNVTTSEPDLWRIIQEEVNDVTALPQTCKNGYLVKVVNSQDTNKDDYWLKYEGNNNQDGPGTWVETTAPGIEYSWDINTLPVTIVRTGTNTFTVDTFKIDGVNAWKNRTVGDNDTNPIPSIDGATISQTFFHRNRLGFLSNGNVVLSQAGDLGNFFNSSALTIAGNDPIDIAASSTVPTLFRDAIETNTGLVIFADNQQFLLHTDSDALTPETGKLSNISTYNYNPLVKPISLGTTLGFTDNAGNYTRFFEMFDIRREGEPQLIDQSKIVHRLLPQDLRIISNSRENSTVFFAGQGGSDVYGYRYFNSGRERIQSAWFRWSFPYSINHTFVLGDEYYIVSVDYKLLRVDLQPNETTNQRAEITGEDYFGEVEVYNLYLDSWTKVGPIASGDYDDVTDMTRVAKSVNLAGSGTAVIVTDVSGSYATPSSEDGSYWYYRGDFSGTTVYIGFLYDMEVTFPRIYLKKQANNVSVPDLTSSLTIHRINLKFGDVGYYSTELQRKGKGSYVATYESTLMDHQEADTAPFTSERLQSIPVYERNTNARLTFKSSHPSPAVIYSMTWEGDYTPKHYRRA